MQTIELETAIDVHGQKRSTVALRDPRYSDYMELGPPLMWIAVGGAGGGYNEEIPEKMREWVERLADIDPNFLMTLSLRDTLALRDAVVRFFLLARMDKTTSAPSTDSPASSSSATDGTSGPSII